MEAEDLERLEQGKENDGDAVDYQLRQLPKDSGFPVLQWRELFSTFTLPVPSFELHESAVIGSSRDVMAWKVDPQAIHHGGFVKYREFGYQEGGNVGFLGEKPGSKFVPGLRAATMSWPQQMDVSPKEHIWVRDEESGRVDIRYGREWIFGLNGVLDESLLSIAALQLCRDVDIAGLGDNSAFHEGRRRIAKCFVTKFKSSWDMELSRDLWGSSDYRWSRSAMFDKSLWEDVIFQYHMRVFTVNPKSRAVGPNLVRSKGRLHLPGNRSPFSTGQVIELRYSVGLKTTWKLEKPVYTLITLADSSLARLRDLEEQWESSEWARAGIQPLGQGTGVAAFAFRIWSLLAQWEQHWLNLLNDLERAFANNINLDIMLSSPHRRGVMIDGSDLQLSEFYFAVSSTLRIAADWIQESMDDLRLTVDDMGRLYFSPRVTPEFPTFIPTENVKEREEALAKFQQTWDNVLSRQRSIGNALLARIDKRQEEIKGLRDGLFSATAVNEATKSTQLSHYILVFTVVTIFYLPLSFVTALFALGFFDLESDPRQTRWFITTTVSVALSTYFFAWLLIWIVQEPYRRQFYLRIYTWLGELRSRTKLP
ncbi:hypothetical protein V8F20_012609 [Naviculisporaceae sp. PSN 640]